MDLIQKHPNHLLSGRIVGVLSRDLRNLVAQVTESISSTLCLAWPVDSRLPGTLIITPSGPEKYLNQKVVISLDDWVLGSKHPFGHIVKVIGPALDPQTEAAAILMEHQVETRPFSQKVLDCLPPDDWTIPPEEEEKRWDLRSEDVCSVDPPGCRDIDDALHSKVLENGNWELGVHIADVTYYVKPDSWIDREAAHRCTTVYLVDRRTDMLPKLLTEVLCSLREKVDRLAFSVIWEIDPETMTVVNTRFGKSIIHSRAALTYQMAYDRIQNKEDNSSVTQSLRRLLEFSKVLKKRRNEKGALTLASSQLKFKLESRGDEACRPSDMSLYTLLPTNSMIEEFMLLANITVARKIVSNFPASAILRKHSSPKPEMIKQFAGLLDQMGFKMDYSSNKSLAESLNRIKRPNDPMFNKLVRILTTRCMHEAVYFCSADFDESEYRHYGLATDIYTHFTSPIRRYADVSLLRSFLIFF
jgi:exosome complex exonuclease DIS3/RRP44